MPSSTSPAGDQSQAAGDKSLVTFGDRLNAFWERNAKAVLAGCTLVVLGVVAKGLWEYVGERKEQAIGQVYAAAKTSEQLKAFVAEHPNHTLAAIAHVRMADEAYEAGRFAEAVTGYDTALRTLEDGALAARVRLGRAIARVQSGNTAEGTTELKQLLDDAKQLRAIRTEAGYHLASLAAEARNSAEVQRISDQLMQIDPASLWSQRTLTLRASLPVDATPAAAAAPGTPEPTAPKQDDAGPTIEFKLPGK